MSIHIMCQVWRRTLRGQWTTNSRINRVDDAKEYTATKNSDSTSHRRWPRSIDKMKKPLCRRRSPGTTTHDEIIRLSICRRECSSPAEVLEYVRGGYFGRIVLALATSDSPFTENDLYSIRFASVYWFFVRVGRPRSCCRHLSVCPSVRLSVKRVDCDKTI